MTTQIRSHISICLGSWVVSILRVPFAALALLVLCSLSPSANALTLNSTAATCDPSTATCVKICSAADAFLGKCKLGEAPPSSSGTGTGSGSSCSPSPGGSTSCGATTGPATTTAGSNGGVQVGAGNPINLISGNKYQVETDLPALPGVLGLELKRHYNSQSTHPGLLGAKWRMSYEAVLVDYGSQIQIIQADGRRIDFQRGTGAQMALCTTSQPEDGQVRIETSPLDARQRSYHWRWPDGRTLSFRSVAPSSTSAGYPLHSITALGGQQLSLSYSPSGDLMQVRDPQGRKLVFIYSGAAELNATQRGRALKAIDTPLGRITYTQDSIGRLTEVAMVQAVREDPGAADVRPIAPVVTKVYHYEDARNAGFKTSLTGISLRTSQPGKPPTEQRLSSFVYDRQGMAVLSTKGLPLELQDGSAVAGADKANGIEQIQLNYVAKALPMEGQPNAQGNAVPRQLGKTILTNSLGAKTEILSAVIGGHYRLIEMRGAGCATCGPTNRRYTYNPQGQLVKETQLDGAGLNDGGRESDSHLTQFDAHGRIGRLGIQAPGASPVLWHTRYGYTDIRYADGSVALGSLPTLIAQPSVVAGKERTTTRVFNNFGQLLSVTESGFSPVNDRWANQSETVTSNAPTPITRTTTYSYQISNGRSLLVQIDGPLANGPKGDPTDSDITRFGWDDRGDQVIRQTVPGGQSSSIQYDTNNGLIVKVKEAEGFATSFIHDALGRMTTVSSTGPGWLKPRVQRVNLDAFGNTVEVLADKGNGLTPQTRQAYDLAGRLLWRANALGMLQQNQFDTEGQLLQRGLYTRGMAIEQSYRYDARGRITEVEDGRPDTQSAHPKAARIRYDPSGQMESWVDALGRERVHAAAPDTASTPIRVPTPAVRQLVDDFGRVVATISPDSGSTLRAFNAADKLVASTDAMGNRAAYAYDTAGRIAKQTITDVNDSTATGPVITRWRYEGKRLVALEHPTQNERYAYDLRGLRISKTVNLKSASGTGPATTHISVTRYAYDEAGTLIGTSLPDGSTLSYQRNGQGTQGQVTALTRSRIQTPWLRWLLPEQTVVKDLERDAVGLRSYTAGNGTQAEIQRSREGKLARVTYRNPQQPHAPLKSAQIGDRLFDLFIATARAADAPSAVASDAAPNSAFDNAVRKLPGAFNLPADAKALIDHRYLWDAQGNLLLTQTRSRSPSSSGHALHLYDDRDRLIASVAKTVGEGEPAQPKAVASLQPVSARAPTAEANSIRASRYFYDESDRRVLSQEGIADQSDLSTGTRRAAFEPSSHRWAGDERSRVQYDNSGQPVQIGKRRFTWDAVGRLTQVSDVGSDSVVATYRYSHRGERNSKTTASNAGTATTAHYLYDNRQLTAELDAEGRITRQYVYLGDQPIALIDTPQGATLDAVEALGLLGQITRDLTVALRAWLNTDEAMVWLHANHLGAIEAATDVSATPIWRASYAPFGSAQLQLTGATPFARSSFTLNLRLPGQYLDAETGLHYNDHRYYDPERGEYLSPDPLGTPDGPNPYAYVRGNPLKYVDPSGLILFAFDGTNNSNPPPVNDNGNSDDFSNVYKFFLAYDQAANGRAWYMNGIGRDDIDSGIESNIFDHLDANTGRLRNDFMLTQIDNYMAQTRFKKGEVVNVDIVGFSRGAAMARDFSNRVAQRLRSDAYATSGACVQMRFLGLWDTVAQFGLNGAQNRYWQLAVPAEVQNVYSAVALNEHREVFPGEAIGRGVQRGFIGSHADIGGSYGTGDLSDVALNWMTEQAKRSGITMQTWKAIGREEWGKVTNPILHDKSTPKRGAREDRDFCLRVNNQAFTFSCPKQRRAAVGGMDWTTSLDYINFWMQSGMDADGVSRTVGTVDMEKYAQWLEANYDVAIAHN